MTEGTDDGPRSGASGMLRGRAVPLVKGQKIAGRYRLDGLLGRGGMGEVWSATHLVTERRVAMKFVETSLRLTDRLRERLFREARAAGRVKHPGVIEIVDAFTTDDDIPVLVMELLEGEPLSKRLRREGALSLDEAADIMLQVVSAVGAAHERGIVHRDLKPDNVFLCFGEDEPRVKVLDFGVAKLAAPGEHGSSGLTSVGQILGTPAYMAPEQCRGVRDLDHRVDIWAIGVMLYELLSGERPIEGDSVGEVVEWLLTEGVPPLRELVPGAPFDLAVMARRLLEREPGARPDDLREVAEVLRRYCDRDVPDFGPAGSSVPSEEPESERESFVTAPTEPAEHSLSPAQHTVRERKGGRTLFLSAAALAVGAGVIWASASGGETGARAEGGGPGAAASASAAALAASAPAATADPVAIPSAVASAPSASASAAPPRSVPPVTAKAPPPPAPRPVVHPPPAPAPKPQPEPEPPPPPPDPKGPKVQDWD